jgi:hypothetical protein
MSATAAPRRHPRPAWIGVAVGWALVVNGARGLLHDADATRPADAARWFAGLLLVHDAILVPVALLVGWAVGRLVPRVAVVPVRLGVAGSAVVLALAWPLVRGYGRRAANPTLLPLDYTRNLLIVLAAIWAVVGVAIVASVLSARARRTP